MTAPDKLPSVYWLTRDTIFGDLSSRVDVWAVRPVPMEISGRDIMWAAPEGADVDTTDTCLGDWSLGEARHEVGNGIPTARLECIRVGEPDARPARDRMAS